MAANGRHLVDVDFVDVDLVDVNLVDVDLADIGLADVDFEVDLELDRINGQDCLTDDLVFRYFSQTLLPPLPFLTAVRSLNKKQSLLTRWRLFFY